MKRQNSIPQRQDKTWIFEDDIREYIASVFDSLDIVYKPSSDLQEDILNLFTIRKKYVSQRPRETNISKELVEKLKKLQICARGDALEIAFSQWWQC